MAVSDQKYVARLKLEFGLKRAQGIPKKLAFNIAVSNVFVLSFFFSLSLIFENGHEM